MAISIPASMPAGEKLTPLEELLLESGRFISIREAVETVKARYPEMTYEQVAEWVYRKARSLVMVNKTFAGITGTTASAKEAFETIAMYGRDILRGNDYGVTGYYRKGLEKALGMNLPAMRADYQDDNYADHQNNAQGILYGAAAANESPATWESKYGMDTALKFIAALAISNAGKDKRCIRGGKLNKSQVIRNAQSALNAYGVDIGAGNKHLSNLIDRALCQAVPELTDGSEL